jgi:hypothetical protein
MGRKSKGRHCFGLLRRREHVWFEQLSETRAMGGHIVRWNDNAAGVSRGRSCWKLYSEFLSSAHSHPPAEKHRSCTVMVHQFRRACSNGYGCIAGQRLCCFTHLLREDYCELCYSRFAVTLAIVFQVLNFQIFISILVNLVCLLDAFVLFLLVWGCQVFVGYGFLYCK